MALTANQVQQAYLAYFGRPADVIGLNYWEGQSQAAMTAGFAASAEFANMYAGMSPAAQVEQVYLNVLGRQADPAGLTYWGVQLTSGAQTIGSLVSAIYNAVLSEATTSTDYVTVANRLAYANAFTSAMTNSTPDIVGYSGSSAASAARAALTSAVPSGSTIMTTFSTVAADVTSVVGAGTQAQATTFTLTTGVDTITPSGNSVINAALDNNAGAPATTATLSGADSITATGTGNTLKLTDGIATAYDTIPVGATISGVQTITLTTAGNAGNLGSTSFDTSGIAGVTTVSVTSAGTHGDQIKAAATTNITDISNGTANQVVTAGGNNVTVTTSGIVDVGYTSGSLVGAAATAAAGAVNVTDTGAGTAAVVATATVTAGTGAITAGTVTTPAGLGAAVYIQAAGAVTVASKGYVTVTGGTAVSATASGATSYATQQADVTASTTASAASVTATTAKTNAGLVLTTAVTGLNALNTTLTDAGATSTQATVNAATLASEVAGFLTQAQRATIDSAYYTAANATGGTQAKADTAAVAALAPIVTAATNASTSASNAATLAQNAAIAASNVVTTDGAAASIVYTDTTNTALASFSATGNYKGTVAVTDGSTLSNTLTSVTLNNAGAATLIGNALTNVSLSNQVNNVTIHNTTIGHADTLTLNTVNGSIIADAAATTVNIVTTDTAGDTITLTAGLATAVNISGTAGVTFTGDTLVAANAVVTASVGGDSITLAAGQSFVGGATGGNTITTADAAVQTVAVNAGTGVNNTLSITAGSDYALAPSSSTTAQLASAAEFSNFNTLEVTGAIVNVGNFTKSTFTGIDLGAGTEIINGLNATQAGNVTALGNAVFTLGVTGATNPGQIDTVHVTANAGDSGASTLTLTPTLAGVEILHLTAVDNIIIPSTALITANDGALTNINIDGAGTTSITFGVFAGNVNTSINASAATGAVTVDASAVTTNPLNITGSTTAANTITGNAVAGDVLTGGNAGDTITAGAAATITDGNGTNTIAGSTFADTITVGNGVNTITAGAGSTITAGNGDNSITDAGITGVNTVTVGTGSNLIVLGGASTDTTGVYNVTLGTHTSTTGIDSISIGSAGTAFATVPNLVVTGAVAGDQIVFANDTNANTVLAAVTAGSTAAATITAVESAASAAAHNVAYSVFGGNTYVAESLATAVASATNTTMIELIGTHTVTAATGHVVIA
ncbi:MAG: DUF4214 domain-containing protein [Ferrovum myxofaciens]|uniref:DUF4214 domain-containing protein n=1 Tax=Ferrovum myxofaciens TaxID=416213 RepID=UPI0023548AF8|nr:DUF4214 domain-containing protein [Ferrovum myxofaciens]QKE40723.1 MAG: DUF4214 domain-containing protein [Ferrovum myxofaciens]